LSIFPKEGVVTQAGYVDGMPRAATAGPSAFIMKSPS